MGNNCYSESDLPDDKQNWRDYMEAECAQLRTEVSWAKPVLKTIKSHSRNPNPQLTGEMLQITESYKTDMQKSRSSSDVLHNKKLNKLLKRSGIAEEDLYNSPIRDNLSCYSSHISATASIIYQEKNTNGMDDEAKEQLEVQVDYFVNLTDTIKEHTSQPNNEIGQIIRQFNGTYHKQYSINVEFQSALYEFQQFSRILQQTLIIYYNLAGLRQQNQGICYLINEDSILNFAVNLLLIDVDTYNILFNSIKQSMNTECRQLHSQLLQLCNITCAQCGIAEDYQLLGEKVPYNKPINTLRKIKQKRGPSSKLKVILKCSKQIISSIQSFNKGRGCSLMVSSEQLLLILTYIVIKAQIDDLEVHITLVDKLSSNRMMASTCGYYLTSLMAAIESIKNMNIKTIIK